MSPRLKCLLLLLAAGCAAPSAPPSPPPEHVAAADGLLPGSIGVLTKRAARGVVVQEVRKESAAASAGVRAGDRVLRFNGAPVSSVREFNRLMLDSPPGSRVHLELERDGDVRRVELPVRELDTMPRA
jgi:S1-C subfamily serine protease